MIDFYKQNTMPDLTSGQIEPTLPDNIGPYKIESLFSKGGMSFLYLGLNEENRTPVIIKVLSPAYVNCPQAVGQFIKEAKIIALSNHPNIVKIYGQGEWEQGLYIAMELIRGVSLKQFISQHSLSLKRALEIILQVAYALEHLHQHGIIHRDLKPENILITEDGDIKVIDFGIAQLHEEKHPSPAVVGTPNYMSPEQKENSSPLTFASDIYSLGIILYELILGKLSYGLITLAGLPRKLKALLAKTLAISPLQRYQQISDFIQDISQYLESGALDKEKPGSDLVKEIQEEIQKASHSLSLTTAPHFPQIDFGIAKAKGPQQLGLYYDAFSLSDDTYLLVFASTLSTKLSSPIQVSFLKGLIHYAIHTHKPPLSLPSLLSTLGQMQQEQLALTIVHLNPLSNLISYIGCGMPPLLHMSAENKAIHLLSSDNDPLGKTPSSTFSEAQDNWNEGDTLIIHSLFTSSDSLSLTNTLQEALTTNALLSAGPQAEAILKTAAGSSAYPLIPYAKAVISLQRLS
ncbi:MAG: ser/Thr protein kinase [Chlamydiota bacterium]|jgi:serine/threonine protein kinase